MPQRFKKEDFSERREDEVEEILERRRGSKETERINSSLGVFDEED